MTKVVRIHEYGDASVLKIEDIEVPLPAADEVQIAVRSIGLNRAEVMFRNHAYLQEAVFPSRLGYEASGVVQAVGDAVTGFQQGDAVSLIPPDDIARWGTYGEVANVPARSLVKQRRGSSPRIQGSPTGSVQDGWPVFAVEPAASLPPCHRPVHG